MYLFYLDESGNKSRSERTLQTDPYFVLACMGIHDSLWRDLDQRIVSLKANCFPEVNHWEVIIKSWYIRRCCYSEPSLSDEELEELPTYWRDVPPERVRQLSEGLHEAPRDFHDALSHGFYLWFVIIDKPCLVRQYAYPKDVYELALGFLFQRLELFLRQEAADGEYGLIVADESTDLKKYHPAELMRRLQHMLQALTPETPTTIQRLVEAPFLVDDGHHNPIQAVDVYAYDVHRAYRDDNPDYRWFRELVPSLHPHPRTNCYGGSGLVMYPPNRAQKPRIWGAAQTTPDDFGW